MTDEASCRSFAVDVSRTRGGMVAPWRFRRHLGRDARLAVDSECGTRTRGLRRSASIAFYRDQAEVFGGKSDGKFGVHSVQVSLFQVLISAGDN